MEGSYGWPMFGMGANSAGWPNIAVPGTGNYVSQSNLADIYVNGRISLPNFGTVSSTSSANAFNPLTALGSLNATPPTNTNPLAALGSPVNTGSNNPLGALPSVNGLEYMSMISSGITMNLLGSANSLMDTIKKSGALDPKNYTQWTPASWGLAPGTAGPGGSSGQTNAGGFVMPLDKQYFKKPGSGGDFGDRVPPKAGASSDHKGNDFGAPAGANIYAVKAGKVTIKPNNGGAGNTVIIDHGNGLVTKYFHMSRFADLSKYKDPKTGVITVPQGTVIGYVGTTGTSTGNHLHFEVHENGVAVNPWQEKYLASLD